MDATTLGIVLNMVPSGGKRYGYEYGDGPCAEKGRRAIRKSDGTTRTDTPMQHYLYPRDGASI